MRTSYSALNTYKICPLKFKYQEIEKIRVPKSVEAVFGSAVHESLKYMFSPSPLYPTLDEVINFFTERWKLRSEKIELKKEEKSFHYDNGVNILKNFYRKNQPWNFNVVDLESRFEILIEDEKAGETHTLAGIIDRIDKPSENMYEIIDYKTASRMPSQEAVDKDLQMSIYHLGILKRWPHITAENIKLSFYFLKHGEKISTGRTEALVPKINLAVVSIIREIQERLKNNDFPPIPSALCDWCGYKSNCPMWSHMYKNQKLNIENQKEIEIEDVVQEYFEIKDVEQKNKKRLAELQSIIHQYLDRQKLERIFGESGYITRNVKSLPYYDLEQAREILEPLGKWNEVLKVDERRLDKLVSKLPFETRQKFKDIVKEFKTTKILSITKSKK
jgi:RecB family exonuclease